MTEKIEKGLLLTDEETHEAIGFGVSPEHHRTLAKAQLAKCQPLIEERERNKILTDVYKWLNSCGYKSVAAGLRHYYKSKSKWLKN